MKVYIAGPMTGKQHYNLMAFAEAEAKWREEQGFDAHREKYGYVVVGIE